MEIWEILALLVGGSLLMAGIQVLHHFTTPEARRFRTIRRVPVSPIRDATDGEPVRIVGTVKPLGYLFNAPVSGRSCVGYDVEVESVPRFAEGPELPDIDKIRRLAKFIVEDETGTAIIDDGELVISFDVSRDRKELSSRVRALLASEGKDPGDRLQVVREGVLAPGSRVTVCGIARWEVDAESGAERGYREQPLRLRLMVDPVTKVIISNIPSLLTRPAGAVRDPAYR